MPTIRPARPADADHIRALQNGIIRATTITFTTVEKTAADIAATIAEGRTLVAHADGAFAGFASYGPFRGGPGYAHTAEHTILTLPAAQGRGIAAALLAAMEDHARGAAIHSLIAGISGENPRAIAFHLKHGYTRAALIREAGWKFGRWLDLVLCHKIL